MPQYMDRHAETRDGYGSEPARSQQRQKAAQDDPAKRKPPAKKDPDLCKAQHWKAGHTPVFQMRKPYTCKWWIDWTVKVAWSCYHEEVCSGCGKVIDPYVKGRRCPEFHGITAAEAQALEREKQERADRIARFQARRVKRPVITGPQGYRKPKEKNA